MYIFCFSVLIRCFREIIRELHFEKGDFACTGHPFAESFHRLGRKGMQRINSKLRG